MTRKTKPHKYWTLERLKEEAQKYQTKMEFARAPGAAYGVAQRDGLIDKVCAHMGYAKPIPEDYWTFDVVKEEASRHKGRAIFRKKARKAYYTAKNNGWLNDVCSHMAPPRRPIGFWTFETISAEARKYKTRFEFATKASAAATVAGKNGWMDEVCAHMPRHAGRTKTAR